MPLIPSLLALALNGAAIALFYLCAPRQQWLAQAWPAQPGRAVASALLLAALLQWWQIAQLATALFAVLTVSMTLAALLPYLAALRTLLRGAP